MPSFDILSKTQPATSILHSVIGVALKNECIHFKISSMPSHGVEIIDGIPVHLKDGNMLAFQHGSSLNADFASNAPIKLGTYDSTTKRATWSTSDAITQWLDTFRATMTGRSRK
jgi:hypothetical protein